MVADERFEDRHRELRKAAEKVDHRTAYDLTNAWPKLEGFEFRTGPLVDDLVAAVREALDFDVPVTVPGHQAAEYLRRDAAVRARLAALDKAGRPGGT